AVREYAINGCLGQGLFTCSFAGYFFADAGGEAAGREDVPWECGAGGDGYYLEVGAEESCPFFPKGEDAHPDVQYRTGRGKGKEIVGAGSVFQEELLIHGTNLNKKSLPVGEGISSCANKKSLFLFLVTFLELVDTAGRVNQYVLPCEEGVRSVGNF